MIRTCKNDLKQLEEGVLKKCVFSLYIHCNPAVFHLVIAAVQGAEQVFNQNYLIGHFLKTNFSRLALALADEGAKY